ncbi:MAG: hypothetical protein GY854_14850 [Deltaproteobacteria bacterium]|nr:hypothetical protein [Deltaproteobacteria bacterium]
MSKSNEKRFIYDVIIDEENICDRKKEIAFLRKAAKGKKRTVLLAPRRYGKTSLIKNVIGKEALRYRPKRIVISVDFMSVSSLRGVAARLNHGIAKGLTQSFSAASLVEQASTLLKQFSMGVDINPLTGTPSLKIDLSAAKEEESIIKLCDAMIEMDKHKSLVLILDEFQDIALVSEAEGLLRFMLQNLQNSAVFILGSKKHLMERMFGNSKAPLFGYGDELTLGPIPLEAWEPYFDERLAFTGATITNAGLKYLLERMCDVPNAICELGAWLQDQFAGKKIDVVDVERSLDQMVEKKQSFAYRLSGMNTTQRELLWNISLHRFVSKPTGKDFVVQSRLSKSTISHTLGQLLDMGLVEHEAERGWRLSDPILAHYLANGQL